MIDQKYPQLLNEGDRLGTIPETGEKEGTDPPGLTGGTRRGRWQVLSGT